LAASGTIPRGTTLARLARSRTERMENVATESHDAAGAWRTRHTRWRKVEAALIALAAISCAVVIWDLTVGGFSWRVLGVRVSSWETYRPFRNDLLFAVSPFWLLDWRSVHAAG